EIQALAPVVAKALPAAVAQLLALHRQDACYEVHLRLIDEDVIAAEQRHLCALFANAFAADYELSVRRLLADLARAGTSVRVHNFLVNLLITELRRLLLGGWRRARAGARAFDLAVRCLGIDIGSLSAAEAGSIKQSEEQRRGAIEAAIVH